MCGRFHNHLRDMHRWAELLKDWPGNDGILRYNNAPTQVVPIVAAKGTIQAYWGMVPSWSKEFKMNYKFPTFNAKIETAHEKKTFKNAWNKSKNCLLPIGGYYEWRGPKGKKEPYLVQQPQGDMMLAGLWENWQDQYSFTIFTTEAKEQMRELHHRTPIALDLENAKAWLEGDYSALDNNKIVDAEYFRVGKEVGNARNEGPSLLRPYEDS